MVVSEFSMCLVFCVEFLTSWLCNFCPTVVNIYVFISPFVKGLFIFVVLTWLTNSIKENTPTDKMKTEYKAF